VSSDAGSDDGAGGYEEDGFLVDSLSEDEEQPKQQKLSRLKKKREKKRKRQKLGLEDLELIQENTGISVAPTEPPKKNRKRAEKRDADSDFPTEPRSPKLSDGMKGLYKCIRALFGHDGIFAREWTFATLTPFW
jgi:hypothetical protein